MSSSFSNVLADRIRKQAKRILAGMVKGSDDRSIFPGYMSFDKDKRPRWWRNGLAPDSWGEILGVHEIKPDCAHGAIVITGSGLGVFNDPLAPIWLPYEAVEGWENLSKDPVSLSLVVRTKDGSKVELLFPHGGAFAFIQFLGCVTEQLFREQNRGGGKFKSDQ
ncbi:hypothetical protein WMF04_25965 [Sorangium sp. So ce260]|uniref:hypothetical protein n=1 Tax=Sorangium sp. So ce260 TaxID=3133291 RepID=UPI003F60A558